MFHTLIDLENDSKMYLTQKCETDYMLEDINTMNEQSKDVLIFLIPFALHERRAKLALACTTQKRAKRVLACEHKKPAGMATIKDV